MPKRFTETDKWKDTWFRKLKPSSKLLWLYILDTCDNAGFWEYDIEMCCFITKMTEEQVSGAVKGLDRGLIGSKNGEVFYVKNFLRHQKNSSLNETNNAHKQIIRLIEEKRYMFDEKTAPFKGLLSPIGIGKGLDKGLGKKKRATFTPPSYSDVENYMIERNKIKEPKKESEKFVDFYTTKNWMVGKNKMKAWRSAVHNWEKESASRNDKLEETGTLVI